MTENKSDKYKEAGVDIDAGEELVKRIAPFAEETRVEGATDGPGGFGGIFDLAAAGFHGDTRLVAGTDGVGTKLKLAFASGVHNTIGIDCVAMCVNDIITTGAKPLFFLDYFATGKLDPADSAAVVEGIAAGCKEAGCWLMGGETAEMPGMYADGEYDLAGFAVGAVTDELEQRPENCASGDVVIALPSSGIHSNGFSLVRSVLNEDSGYPWQTPRSGQDIPLVEELLTPTRIYVNAVQALQKSEVKIHASSHITGGGLWENPQRSIPEELAVSFDVDAVREQVHPIFRLISQVGEVSESEMYRVFNMGIGFLVIVHPDDVDTALSTLRECGESPTVVGELVSASGDARVHLPGLMDTPLQ
jgi:phosphoribosylformylglycinamidine cyclo-ligase